MSAQKNILIIGATGGIGQAIVRTLANENNHLILVAKNTESLQKIASDIEGSLCSITHYSVDLEDTTERKKFCVKILEQYNYFDWIIHSAGFIDKSDSLSEPVETVARKTFEINFFAPYFITNDLSPILEKDGGVIFISSTAGISGNGFSPAYASSKGALNSFAKSLSLSWQNTQKRSIVICPGATNTAMREKFAGDSKDHQSPEVIAELVRAAIKDDINYPNGTSLTIKNGAISF